MVYSQPPTLWPYWLPTTAPLIFSFQATLNSLLFLNMSCTHTSQDFSSSCSFCLERLSPTYHLANALRLFKSLLNISMHFTLTILSISSSGRTKTSTITLFLLFIHCISLSNILSNLLCLLSIFLPLEHKPQQGIWSTWAQSLAHSKCYINICWFISFLQTE